MSVETGPIRRVGHPRDPQAGSRAMLPEPVVRRAPKALLHDHLDGGVRPATVVELAGEIGYEGLPTTDVESCSAGSWPLPTPGRWCATSRRSPTPSPSCRPPPRWRGWRASAREDLAADGVVYAEVRFAPELHLDRGSRSTRWSRRCCEGSRRVSAARPRGARSGSARCSPRCAAARSREIAELTVAYRDPGVVGFDIAGAEAGFPPSRHLDAFEYLRGESMHITIHAGEAFGLPSIHEAVACCGCERLGHGVRIVDDIVVRSDGEVALGRLAGYVRDLRIPLELCPSSNVQTGAAPSIAEHPIGLLSRLRFRVTVNTDNRLMSGTSMTREMLLLSEAFGWGLREMQWVTVNALKSAFIPFDERLALIDQVVKPGYAALAAELG